MGENLTERKCYWRSWKFDHVEINFFILCCWGFLLYGKFKWWSIHCILL